MLPAGIRAKVRHDAALANEDNSIQQQRRRWRVEDDIAPN